MYIIEKDAAGCSGYTYKGSFWWRHIAMRCGAKCVVLRPMVESVCTDTARRDGDDEKTVYAFKYS